MSRYQDDWSDSDKVWKVVAPNLSLIGWGEPDACISEATRKEDTDHSVDAYYNGVPVQYRFQTHNPRCTMVATLRCKRPNSSRPEQVRSELHKIFKNYREGKLYPKKLVWGTVDSIHDDTITPENIKSIMIYDIDHLIEECKNGRYNLLDEELTPEAKLQFGPDGVGTFHNAEIFVNKDGSSSFVILRDMATEFSYSRRDS
jgi:hypothetical protein